MVPSQHSALRGAFEWIAVIAIALAVSCAAVLAKSPKSILSSMR